MSGFSEIQSYKTSWMCRNWFGIPFYHIGPALELDYSEWDLEFYVFQDLNNKIHHDVPKINLEKGSTTCTGLWWMDPNGSYDFRHWYNDSPWFLQDTFINATSKSRGANDPRLTCVFTEGKAARFALFRRRQTSTGLHLTMGPLGKVEYH